MSSSSVSRSVTPSPMDRSSKRPTRYVWVRATALSSDHIAMTKGRLLTPDRHRERRALRRLSRVCPTGSSAGVESASGVDGYVMRRSGPCLEHQMGVRADRTGYYNPLIAYGEEQAVQAARDAGANGFIMVDLPPEEALKFRDLCTSTG